MTEHDLDFLVGVSERAADQSEACKAILDVAGSVSQRHGEEHGIWLLMASLAIACRAVNITPQQSSAAMRVIRKRVDEIVKRIGHDSVSVQDIIIEMHVR